MLQANFPNKIVYGLHSLSFLEKIAMNRAVILADKIFCDHNPSVVQLLKEILNERKVEHWFYFAPQGDPTLEFAKEKSKELILHQPDLLIGIGGGSVLDSLKVMDVYYEHPDISLEKILNRFNLPPVQKKAKIVAIPTTSGTGSEVSAVSVLYVPTGNPKLPLVKKGIADYQLIPNYVILDPRFTVTMPFGVTASTGLDAFVHCIEGYVNKNPKNVFMDYFALEGMKKVTENLERVLKNPEDLTARSEMQIAATMGGFMISGRGSGASHGSGKQLATLVHLAHGISVAIPLEQVIRKNSEKCLKEYATIAYYLGLKATSDYDAVEALIAKWNNLLEITKCPRTISELGISREKFEEYLPAIVQNAQKDPAMKGNPIPLSTTEIEKIYRNLDK
ncbi:iron-containing alcohol dehydrogenase family protein [Acidaminococcus massiliensis]|uniref:iron-containing alcohol dehydrogenase family protein n=1 Tax=Acidaminococcus massiliensis TaxID=1852375 RepID=UPI0026DA936B|nr:iron-containing alcohol dehydrogenase family protein [Acidaminococcus massiliensis]